MNRDIQAFLDAVCEGVRCREVHGEIRLELAGHLEDRMEMHIAAGLSEQEAVRRALADMGDPALIGQQLNETHKPRTEWGLIGATLLFVLLGVWAMYAVDVNTATASSYGFFGTKLMWSTVGLGAGAVLFFANYQRLRRYSWPLYLATLAGSAILTLRASWAHGEPRWVGHTPMLYAVALAGLFATWDWNRPWAAVKALALLALPLLVYLGANGLAGESLQYIVIFAVLLLLSRPHRRHILAFSAIGLMGTGAAAFYIWSKAYLRMRVMAMLFPFQDPRGAGYQAIQSRLAIRHAGWWGQGATANLDRLPEVQSTFVFPYLVYTLGWVAGLAIVGLILFFIGRLIVAARQVKDLYGSFLITAIGALFAYRFGLNLLMTMGLLPVTGVDLPLVSHGVQGAIQLSLVGLALGIFRRKDMNSNRTPLLPG